MHILLPQGAIVPTNLHAKVKETYPFHLVQGLGNHSHTFEPLQYDLSVDQITEFALYSKFRKSYILLSWGRLQLCLIPLPETIIRQTKKG